MDGPGYTAREVAELLGLSVAEVRRCARAGILSRQAGPDGQARFSFQDLVLLRRAASLVSARVRPHRVRKALQRLREQLPAGRPLSGIHVEAAGDRLIAREGPSVWEPVTGQLHLDFGAARSSPQLPPPQALAVRPPRATPSADTLAAAERAYDEGCRLEDAGDSGAADAYRAALLAHPGHANARINLGRMLHAAGQLEAAAAEYRRVLAAGPSPLASFNLGVALEDLGKPSEAVAAYHATIAEDPGYEDAYFNLARLYERRGERAFALRALKTYRQLTRRR